MTEQTPEDNVRQRLEELVPLALETLVDVAQNAEDPEIRAVARKDLIDRGFGHLLDGESAK